jgi:hypothetical protein
MIRDLACGAQSAGSREHFGACAATGDGLEHVPEKLTDFSDQDMLQFF